jgi:hypothetical protein
MPSMCNFGYYSLVVFLYWHYMFRPNRPSSGVKVVMIKEPAAHCRAVLCLLCGCLGLLLVMWVNHLFQFWCHWTARVCLTWFTDVTINEDEILTSRAMSVRLTNVFFLFGMRGKDRPFGTLTAVGPWYKPWAIPECGVVGGMITGTGNLSKRKKPWSGVNSSTTNPHDLTSDGTWATAVANRRLSAMMRPIQNVSHTE